MKVDQIMTQSVHTCRSSDSLDVAAQVMCDTDCGCVPVVSDDDSARVVGMLTNRDICMAAHFQDKTTGEIPIGAVMSQDVRSVAPLATLQDAETLMREAQIRRVPVIDAKQQLVGVLSLADLALEAGRKRASSRPPITGEEVGNTISAICVPCIPSGLAGAWPT